MALRRAKRISNADIFEATISRGAAQGRFIDELLGMFGGRMQPLMAHLIESGRLTMKDVQEAEDPRELSTCRQKWLANVPATRRLFNPGAWPERRK
jgi:BlaI family penicillinase repressor